MAQLKKKNAKKKETAKKKQQKKLTFYVAAKLSRNEAAVRDLIRFVKNLGHTITFDWTTYPVERPFAKNKPRAHDAAEKMAVGVMNADVVIVLADRAGLGLHIETGGALVAGIILQFIKGQKDKRIFIVGKDNKTSIFYYHKSVTRVRDIEAMKEVIKSLQ